VSDALKPIRCSKHVLARLSERGTTVAEIEEAIRVGLREPARAGKWMYRYNREFNAHWQGKHYAIKQVCPIVAETESELFVVTVYTFYF